MDTKKLINEIADLVCADHCDGIEGCHYEQCGIWYAIDAIKEKAERGTDERSKG